jgi:hypothetical protein
MFKLFVLAAVLAGGLVATAQAQTSCTTVGNTTYCNGPGGSYSCTRVGNTMYCS